MWNTFKRFIGFSDEDERVNQSKLASLSNTEIEEKLTEGRKALIREFRLTQKPGQLICGIVGMDNLGNTCFMASALQCLINSKSLTVRMLTSEWEASLNTVSSVTKGRLAAEYYLILKKIWCEQNDHVSPSNIKNTITKVCKSFAGYSQQDSQEFLSFFLDILHEDLNQVIRKPYEVLKDYSIDQPIESFIEDRVQSHQRRNRSFVVDTFHGHFYSKLQCPDCNNISASVDPFDMISMNIPSQEKRLFEGYLVGFTHEELVKEFRFHCNESEELSNVLNHICEANNKIDPIFFQPAFYLRSRVVERPPFPYQISVRNAMDNEAILFISQVFDPKVMQLVFEDRAQQALDKLRAQSAFSLRFLIFEGDQMVGIEREVVVPELTTSFDVHLLAYIIYRPAFIAACIKDNESMNFEIIETREQLLSEFRLFWPENDIEMRKALFVVNIDNKTITHLNENISMFKHTFENRLNFEVHVNTRKFLNSLKLKKCSKIEVSNMSTVEKPLTLNSCFESFTLEERLDKDNMWYCPKCKDHKQAFKKMAIARSPEILIIHLKRFKKEIHKNHFVNYKKNTSFVDFPIKNFDISQFAFGIQAETKYNLFAVSNHYGNVGGGHYTSYCKNFLHKKWYCFDDTDVSKQDESDVVTEAAYVLFYQKQTSR
jgi:ubiquitin C-terminal hydrolase